MDQFFAAIAVLDDPSLRGKPVLVGGSGPRGVVSTASYEARQFGCHSAMPMSVARRLCPKAIVVKVPGDRIRELSKAMFAVLDDFSPLVQPLSVDEAFLDMTGTRRLLGPPEQVARQLKQRVLEATGLRASVGVAFNKFLAKLGSDLHKPDGLTVITPDNLDAVLLPLPVEKIWGVGAATQRKLERHHVRTVGDLRAMSHQQLQRSFGELGDRFFRLCRGIDDRPVVPDRTAKSIGHEQTFSANLTDPDAIRAVMLDQAEQVGYRLRRQGFRTRGVTIKVRFGDFQTITRSQSLDNPTDLTEAIYHAARGLFDHWAASSFQSVRLIGVSCSPLTQGHEQADLFADPHHDVQKKLDATLDRIADRFGKRTVRRGGV